MVGGPKLLMAFIVHRGGIMMFSLVYSSTNVLEFGLLFNCWWAPLWCFLRPAYYKCQISLFLSVNSQPRACYSVYRSILGTFGWRKHVFTVSALSSISLVDPFFWTMPGCAVFIFIFLHSMFLLFSVRTSHWYFNLRWILWCVPLVQNSLEGELPHAEHRYK